VTTTTTGSRRRRGDVDEDGGGRSRRRGRRRRARRGAGDCHDKPSCRGHHSLTEADSRKASGATSRSCAEGATCAARRGRATRRRAPPRGRPAGAARRAGDLARGRGSATSVRGGAPRHRAAHAWTQAAADCSPQSSGRTISSADYLSVYLVRGGASSKSLHPPLDGRRSLLFTH
jgi:hypothetical protein